METALDRVGEVNQKLKAEKITKMQVADHLAACEKKIHSRATVLQCQKKNFLKVLQLGYQMVRMLPQADAIKERIE